MQGIVRTVERLRAIDPEIVDVHVDATDLYEATSPGLLPEAVHRQAVVFLALDLIGGQLQPGHALFEWLMAHGASATDIEWFSEHAVRPDVIGINLYPLFSGKRLVASRRGLRVRMRYASADIIDRLSDLYWERYRRPLLISETASEGSVARRRKWLDESVQATARVRARGIPLVGYTWWPLFALVTWSYREGRRPPDEYLKQMGLWDLVLDATGGLERVRTPLVDRYRELIAGGATDVGLLDAATEQPEASNNVP